MAGVEHRIELATLSDALSIGSLGKELIDEDAARNWRERAAKAIASPNANVAVVREGDVVVAAGIMDYSDPDVRVTLLAVTPRCQHQGIGSALLTWFEATALVAGARAIEVEVRREDAAARRFYKGAGYHKMHIDRDTYWKSLDKLRFQSFHSPPQPRGRLKLPKPRK